MQTIGRCRVWTTAKNIFPSVLHVPEIRGTEKAGAGYQGINQQDVLTVENDRQQVTENASKEER